MVGQIIHAGRLVYESILLLISPHVCPVFGRIMNEHALPPIQSSGGLFDAGCFIRSISCLGRVEQPFHLKTEAQITPCESLRCQ